jgi:hypothetical protein
VTNGAGRSVTLSVSKIARFIVAVLLIVLLVSIATSWGLFQFGREPQSQVAWSLLQKFVQPLGTALLTALYYWNEYLKPKPKSSLALATSQSLAGSDAVSTASPQVNVVNNVQITPASPSFLKIDELAENVIEKIAANRNLTAASVVAEKFVLVDSAGNRRATLGFADGGAAGLWSFDAEGRQRVFIGLGNNQDPIVYLMNQRGTPRIAMIDAEKITGLTIKDDDGGALLNVSAHSDDSAHISSVVLYDPRTKAQLAIAQNRAVSPGLLFCKDADGTTVWSYPPVARK